MEEGNSSSVEVLDSVRDSRETEVARDRLSYLSVREGLSKVLCLSHLLPSASRQVLRRQGKQANTGLRGNETAREYNSVIPKSYT